MSIAEILARPARVALRPLTLEDVPALHEAFIDPEVMRYWARPPHTTLDETEQWVARSVEAAGAGRSIEMAAEHEGAFIGRVGFWRDNEIGFLFLRNAWGKGLGREVVARTIAHAFSIREWPVVFADVDPRNERCLRMLAALGFRETGRAARTYCVGGEWTDSVYLELSRSSLTPAPPA